jgi:hypothetical protein
MRTTRRAWSTGWVGVAALALLVAGTGRDARADAIDAKLAEARAAFVRRLEAVAAWCNAHQVYGERDDVYRRILAFQPDHATAREFLKYRRVAKVWVQSPDYVAPTNWNKANVPEARKRLRAASEPYRDAVLAVLEEAGPDLPATRREQLMESLLDLCPDDPAVRRARGDVEHEGRWVLPETVDGIKRRAALAAAKREAAKDAPEPTHDEKTIAEGWEGAARTEQVLVYGHVPSDECEKLAATLEITHRFLIAAVGKPMEDLHPRQVILLPDRDTARRLVKARTGDEWADVLRKVELVSGLWLPTGALMSYREEASERRVAVLRQQIDVYLDAHFRGRQRGWVSEGLGQRLCKHAAGRHGPGFVNVETTELLTGDDEDVRVPPETEEWMGAAARALDRDPGPRIRAVLTMRLNAMKGGDVLAAYALAAYLLEGRAEALLPMLEATMASDDADKQCRDALGVDAETLAWRVRRWAAEAAR